jgi:hypothetical protein
MCTTRRVRATHLSGRGHSKCPVMGDTPSSCVAAVSPTLVCIVRLLKVVCDFAKIYENARASPDGVARPMADVFKLCLVGEVVARFMGDPPPSACLPCASAYIFGHQVQFFICCPSDAEYRAPAWLASAIRYRSMGFTQPRRTSLV